ncbi:cytochrome c [Rhodopseudomonas palustris]|uniref:c-type cytochrome n=1 Tax=Rhodopseudomonas palustris TaxID=1076 RepID=UPI0020CCB27C|nr:cytochrome c [Rhodopseudomonas palustris]
MTRILTIIVAVLIVAAALAGWFFFWPATLTPVAASSSQPSGAALIARGAYLTTAADCESCHTAPGGKPFAGGRAFKLPFGTIYSTNITPDAATGLGQWSDAEFVRALHQGIGRAGEDLYPALPYTSYALLSTDDVLAIRAYLATLRPVATQPPANTLSFPFNQRFVLRAWKLLFMPTQPWQPSPERDAQWNKGAYLVEALAHCGECHTPRNFMFAMKRNQKFAGAVVDGYKAYNITPDAETGIGRWSDAEISAYLATGHAPGHGGASGGMAEAIKFSLGRLPREDIAAITAYLKTVPPQRSTLSPQVNTNPATLASAAPWVPGDSSGADPTGLRIFASACASCHGWDGSGRQTGNASLRGARSVNDVEGVNVVRTVLQGFSVSSPTGSMPAFAAAYSNDEIAAVTNYVIGHFGGKPGRVTPQDVKAARD